VDSNIEKRIAEKVAEKERDAERYTVRRYIAQDPATGRILSANSARWWPSVSIETDGQLGEVVITTTFMSRDPAQMKAYARLVGWAAEIASSVLAVPVCARPGELCRLTESGSVP
jgi:hypothetical protein